MTLHRSEVTAISWDELPAVITTYVSAHRAHDVATAMTTFTVDAVVTDEGHTHCGRQEIAAWLDSAGSEYTFTTEFTGATRSGETDVEVVQHLEGDFPGGVADLRYGFELSGALISRLVIEP